MGRELGEGEIRVKRVVLTALRAWLAVVIKVLKRKNYIRKEKERVSFPFGVSFGT